MLKRLQGKGSLTGGPTGHQQHQGTDERGEGPVGYLLLPLSSASASCSTTCAAAVTNSDGTEGGRRSAYTALGTAEPTSRCPLLVGRNFIAGATQPLSTTALATAAGATGRALDGCPSPAGPGSVHGGTAVGALGMDSSCRSGTSPSSPAMQGNGLILTDVSISNKVHAYIFLQATSSSSLASSSGSGWGPSSSGGGGSNRKSGRSKKQHAAQRYTCVIQAFSQNMCFVQSGSPEVPLTAEALAPLQEVRLLSGDVLRIGDVEGRIFFGPNCQQQEEACNSYTRVAMPPRPDAVTSRGSTTRRQQLPETRCTFFALSGGMAPGAGGAGTAAGVGSGSRHPLLAGLLGSGSGRWSQAGESSRRSGGSGGWSLPYGSEPGGVAALAASAAALAARGSGGSGGSDTAATAHSPSSLSTHSAFGFGFPGPSGQAPTVPGATPAPAAALSASCSPAADAAAPSVIVVGINLGAASSAGCAEQRPSVVDTTAAIDSALMTLSEEAANAGAAATAAQGAGAALGLEVRQGSSSAGSGEGDSPRCEIVAAEEENVQKSGSANASTGRGSGDNVSVASSSAQFGLGGGHSSSPGRAMVCDRVAQLWREEQRHGAGQGAGEGTSTAAVQRGQSWANATEAPSPLWGSSQASNSGDGGSRPAGGGAAAGAAAKGTGGSTLWLTSLSCPLQPDFSPPPGVAGGAAAVLPPPADGAGGDPVATVLLLPGAVRTRSEYCRYCRQALPLQPPGEGGAGIAATALTTAWQRHPGLPTPSSAPRLASLSAPVNTSPLGRCPCCQPASRGAGKAATVAAALARPDATELHALRLTPEMVYCSELYRGAGGTSGLPSAARQLQLHLQLTRKGGACRGSAYCLYRPASKSLDPLAPLPAWEVESCSASPCSPADGCTMTEVVWPMPSDRREHGGRAAAPAAATASSPRGGDRCSWEPEAPCDSIIFTWISVRRWAMGRDPLEAKVLQPGAGLGGMSTAVSLGAPPAPRPAGPNGRRPPRRQAQLGRSAATAGQHASAFGSAALVHVDKGWEGSRECVAAAAALVSFRAHQEERRRQRRNAACRSTAAGVLVEGDEDVTSTASNVVASASSNIVA